MGLMKRCNAHFSGTGHRPPYKSVATNRVLVPCDAALACQELRAQPGKGCPDKVGTLVAYAQFCVWGFPAGGMAGPNPN